MSSRVQTILMISPTSPEAEASASSRFTRELSPIRAGFAQAKGLFLYFSDLTFTSESAADNRLVKVSKSRTGDFQRFVALLEQSLSYFGMEYSTRYRRNFDSICAVATDSSPPSMVGVFSEIFIKLGGTKV